MRSAPVRPSIRRPSRSCQDPAEPRFGQARKPRSGRSGAKWLDRAVDRRTISRRDGRRSKRRSRSSANSQSDRGALVEERQEAAINCGRSQNSERVRAHLYERKFRAKPVRDCEASERRQHGRCGIVRRTRQMQTTRVVRPDERDIGIGRKRPRPTRPWGEEGGWQRGSLTPRFSPIATSTAVRTPTRAAQIAAQRDRAKCNVDSEFRIAPRPFAARQHVCCVVRSAYDLGGTLLPRLRSPAFFSLSWIVTASRGTSEQTYGRLAIGQEASPSRRIASADGAR